jgi:serine O-acetyltransferase
MEFDYVLLTQKEEMVVPLVWQVLRGEAQMVSKKEPLMKPLIDEAILQHDNFKDALIYRLATKMGGKLVSTEQWVKIFNDAHGIEQEEFQYDLVKAACLDIVAVKDRDPACDTLFTAFMFYKGYKALQIYRVSHVLWKADRKELASLLQSRTSEVFGVDIHPAAKIGRGLMIDHASGLVIGETAVVGEHCSFLHGITLVSISPSVFKIMFSGTNFLF